MAEEFEKVSKWKKIKDKILLWGFIISLISLGFATKQIIVTNKSIEIIKFKDTTVFLITYHFMYNLKDQAKKMNDQMAKDMEMIRSL